jgi:hypothetical protein
VPPSSGREKAPEGRDRPGALVVLLGAVLGLIADLDLLAAGTWIDHHSARHTVYHLAAAVLAGALLVPALRGLAVAGCERLLGVEVCRRFRRGHTLSYGALLLLALPAGGWQPGAGLFWITGALFALANGAALLRALPGPRREDFLRSRHWLSLLFFFSGISALIYQVTWQRALFSSFGANIESVTIIVTIFMLGLGLGSLLGGRLTRRPLERLPAVFFTCELLIGAFGLVSLPLIRGVGQTLATAPLPVVTLATAGLLLPPTLLMGATLPILVQYLYGLLRHMSRTVGLLYFVNTLGSAFACFWTADVLFSLAGQQAAVVFAALCNGAVGLLVLDYARRLRRPARAVPSAAAVSWPAPAPRSADGR